MTLCREWTLVKRNGLTEVVEPLKCRCWHCNYCAPIRQSQLRKIAFLGSPNSFLTLTVNPAEFSGPDERARKLVWAWRRLRIEIMRLKKTKKLPFLAVFEKTKKGEPHLHIVMRAPYVDQKWISEKMMKYMKAPIVDIRRVHQKSQIAVYISKYLSKNPIAFEGAKRYWRSQDWLSAEQKASITNKRGDNVEFEIVRQSMQKYVRPMLNWCKTSVDEFGRMLIIKPQAQPPPPPSKGYRATSLYPLMKPTSEVDQR